jgi:hypothetical protein
LLRRAGITASSGPSTKPAAGSRTPGSGRSPNAYYDWLLHHADFVLYMIAMATKFLDTFRDFPPRHPPASFTIDQAVEKLHQFLAND